MNFTKNNTQTNNGLKLPYLCVLYVVIFSSNFLSAQIAAVVFLLLVLITLTFGNNKSSKNYLSIVWPIVGIFIIGMFGIFGNKEADIIRDMIYALSPIALIYLGYWFAGRNFGWQKLLKAMVLAGIVLSLIHLHRFVLNPALIVADLNTVTKESYVSGDLVVLAFVLGLYQNRFHLGNLFPRFFPRSISLIVLLFSFMLSYSRTELVIFLVLCFALLGYLHRFNRRSAFIVAAVTTLVLAFSAIPAADSSSASFITKLVRSITEVSISNYNHQEDINSNWRGFETYRVMATYMTGGALEKIFGQGFGSLVSLGFTMTLAGSDYDRIPVVHNGYAYILIKTGVVGLTLYGLFYLKLLRKAVSNANSKNRRTKFLALLLLGIVLSLVITMYVVGGPPEVHSSEFVLLLGYLTRQLKIERENFAELAISGIHAIEHSSHK
ncbi:MAG: O-antigen ligase family protein [Glaciimonas sp.]|nr:O-antigen ligase family protein [Glaciimonas sp.]